MTARRAYPRKAEIDRVVSAVRATGIQVGAVRISPDGTIEVVQADAIKPTDFDRFEGQL